MPSFTQSSRIRIALTLVAAFAVVCSVGTLAVAQSAPVPKLEIFGGYSFLFPQSNLHALNPNTGLAATTSLETNPRGVGASVTYNVNRWFGMTGDFSGHWGSGESAPKNIDDSSFYNISVGPRLTYRRQHLAPFIEGMVGWHRLTSDVFGSHDQIGFLMGGGIDVPFNRHFALRLIQGDYVYSNHQFGPSSIVPSTDLRGARVQSGFVFMFGGGPAPLVAANCSVTPSEVMVGEPVTATVTPINFNPRHTLTYAWSSTGGTVRGKDTTASIDTNGVAGGSYTVTARVSDPKMKEAGQATCSSNFMVKEPLRNPPMISCVADPFTVQTGTSSTITCNCTSPDNVSVTIGDWSTSAGSLSGSGSTATLSTSGASAGSVSVSAICTDSRGLHTGATALVTVENPPAAVVVPPSPRIEQLETRLALHSIYFPTAQPTVKNPEGGLLASQEKTLNSLADDFKEYLGAKPDAHLTLEGHCDQRGSVAYNQALSERRVERTKRFLTEHGIPEANLETKGYGKQRNLTDAEVKDAVENNPELTPEERQKALRNLTTIRLASNRRVDVTLSTTGQQSVRQYPFNAEDSLTLLSRQAPPKTNRGVAKKKAKRSDQ